MRAPSRSSQVPPCRLQAVLKLSTTGTRRIEHSLPTRILTREPTDLEPLVKKEPALSQSTSPTTLHAGGAGRDQMMKEGCCFHCQEQGHLARDCPIKTASPELKELEQRTPVSEQDNKAGNV